MVITHVLCYMAFQNKRVFILFFEYVLKYYCRFT